MGTIANKIKREIYALRTVHILGALFLMFCSFFLIYSGIAKVRSSFNYISLFSIGAELLAVSINKWDCPLHPLHKKLNDEKAFFGLFLPQQYTRFAMIFCTSVMFFAVSFFLVRLN